MSLVEELLHQVDLGNLRLGFEATGHQYPAPGYGPKWRIYNTEKYIADKDKIYAKGPAIKILEDAGVLEPNTDRHLQESVFVKWQALTRECGAEADPLFEKLGFDRVAARKEITKSAFGHDRHRALEHDAYHYRSR